MLFSRRHSKLEGRWWNVPQVGRVTLAKPSTDLVAAVDREWSRQRPASDWHQTWRWQQILDGVQEAYALVSADHAALALWSSKKKKPIKLPEGTFYRLDNLEVVPASRGGVVGTFTLALIAARATELDADRIVLAAFPIRGLCEAYERAGAIGRCPQGWNCPRNLVPFVFEPAAVELLKAFADGLLEEENT